MKTICQYLAVIFFVVGAIFLGFARGNEIYIIVSSILIGYALILGIAYSVLNNQDRTITVISRLSNPQKVAALDLSCSFVIARLKSESKLKIKENSGTVIIDQNGSYVIQDVEFELPFFNGEKSDYKYKYGCMMTYLGGDIYSLENWNFSKLEVKHRFSGKKVALLPN